VAYYFAKKLNSELHIPVGLIDASWGGTPAETWTPALVVNGNGILRDAAIHLVPSSGWPVTPGAAFNGMIAPVLNYAVAGAIWYQGESNTGTSESYQQLISDMVRSWRDLWKKQFPFYFVQLAPFHYENKNVAALLREQQVRSLSIPATGMVVTTDLADDTMDIHPKNKRDVGFRLAKMALADLYGGDTTGSRSPVFRNMEVDKDKIILSFDHSDGAIVSKGIPSGVLIAGDDRKFFPATVRFNGDKMIVSARQVKQPVAVRYAFSNTAIGNLFSKTGLPVSPFRTDNWMVDTSNEKQNP
jgi:sialate O-acetylesterase